MQAHTFIHFIVECMETLLALPEGVFGTFAVIDLFLKVPGPAFHLYPVQDARQYQSRYD